MGNYATVTSVRHLLVRYFDGASSAGDFFGSSLASHHIDRAEAKVNSRLITRYSLPFTVVPPEVRRITEDIACLNIIKASNYQGGQRKNEYYEEFKSAVDDLEAIAKGEAGLTLTNGTELEPKSAARFVSSDTGYTPIFGKDDPTAWERDSDEESAQEAKRS